MSKNNSYRFPTTALFNPQPRPTEKKRVGLMLIDETPCLVCGGPVADIHDKYCSKRCVAESVKIKQEEDERAAKLAAKIQKRREWWKNYAPKNADQIAKRKKNSYEGNKEKILAQKKKYFEENKETILAKAKAKRDKA